MRASDLGGPEIPSVAPPGWRNQGAGGPAPATPPPTQPLATDAVGERLFAGFIDFAVVAVASALLCGIHTRTLTSASNPSIHTSQIYLSLNSFGWALFALVSLVYFFVLEWRFGRTAGKLTLGLRVVGVDGHPPSMRAILIRTAGRIIDFLPLFYLAGATALATSSTPRQRIGDRLAHTTVLRD